MQEVGGTVVRTSNKVQIIVRCEEYEKNLNNIASIGTIKYKLPMIQAYVVEVKQEWMDAVLEDTLEWQIEVDHHITAQMNRASDLIGLQWAHEHGYYGENVGVAILDTGISLHNDFLVKGENRRIIAFKDFINNRPELYDDNGHGTHVAGIVGGNGYSSKGRYTGVAPKCNYIIVKVLNYKGDGNISDVLAGLQWVIDNKEKYNIRIVNISVGTATKEKADENSLLVKAVDEVWNHGIVVVVAAGNNGPGPMSISTPGISRKVITVGSSDDNITVELYGNKVTDYSGRGPTSACIKKPDIVAPGSNIVSCNAVKYGSRFRPSPFFKSESNMLYTVKSGTSMATPIVSGAIALLLGVHPEMTNLDVKMKLKSSAKDLGYGWQKQGWGLLQIPTLLS